MVEVAVGHATEKFDGEGLLLDDEVRRELADSLATLRSEVQPLIAAAAA